MAIRDWFYNKNFNPGNYIVSTLIIYLRAMFLANSQLGFTICDELNMDEPSQLSGLLIIDKNTWDTKFTDHRPSVVVKNGTLNYGGGIQSGDFSRVLNAGIDLPTSTMEIVTLPVVLSCMAKADLEAGSIASMVAAFIHEDKRWAHVFGLYGLTSPQIGPSIIYNSQNSTYIAEVSLSISVTKKIVARLLPENKLQALLLYMNDIQIAKLTED